MKLPVKKVEWKVKGQCSSHPQDQKLNVHHLESFWILTPSSMNFSTFFVFILSAENVSCTRISEAQS